MSKRILSISILLLGMVLTLACSVFGQKILTPTVQPAPTSIPGWKKFEGAGAEIWLPASFTGGDLTQKLGEIVDKLKTLGPDFEQIANTIEQNPSAFALWAFDSKIGTSGFLTNVNIVKESVGSDVTVDMYADALKEKLPSSLTIVDQKKVTLDRYEAVQLAIEMQISAVEAKELAYIIKNGDLIWMITYATGKSEFDQRRPVFETSANTFRIQP